MRREARELLNAIGGRENISAVSHCMTRMRFVLTDEKKADIEAIEGIGCVKGTFTQAGQFQVIIGNDVSVFSRILPPARGSRASARRRRRRLPRTIRPGCRN